MEKDKDKRKMKRDALKSFLEASTTQNTPEVTKSEVITEAPEVTRINSQPQQQCEEVFLDENNTCVACKKELDVAKMKNGFCNMPACLDHLRKRRRKKGKFQRICDLCEDNVIYEIYTKLQAKAEESLNVAEQIVALKHQQFVKEVEIRRQKRRQIGFKTMSLQQKYQQQTVRITNEQNKLMSVQHQVESLGLSVMQLEAFVTRVQTSFKQNFQSDFNILSEQNARLAKELAKIQKKCLQVRLAMEKKEKQIQQAFTNWQQRQFKAELESEEKMKAKKKQTCQLY